LNTRLFKEYDEYIIAVSSVKKGATSTFEHKGKKYRIEYGDFSSYLEECVMYLKQALKYSSNDTQKRMVENMIASFETGSMKELEDSQTASLEDKEKNIQSTMGHIQNNMLKRGAWQNFIGIANNKKTEMYKKLISASETLLPLFPWPKEHNADKFEASHLDLVNYDTIWNSDIKKQNKEDSLSF